MFFLNMSTTKSPKVITDSTKSNKKIRNRVKKPFLDCNFCGKQFKSKSKITKHVHDCEIRRNEYKIKCNLCGLVFKNKGNLSGHLFFKHDIKCFKSDNVCTVCEKTFMSEQTLKFHIRQQHFNLKGKAPYCEMKKVNQVWFEKVLNSNNVIEIKKTGNNTLLMKRLSSNTAIKVKENNTNVIDVTHIYPLNKRNSKIKCRKCNKFVLRCNLQRHLRSTTNCQPDTEDDTYVSWPQNDSN